MTNNDVKTEIIDSPESMAMMDFFSVLLLLFVLVSALILLSFYAVSKQYKDLVSTTKEKVPSNLERSKRNNIEALEKIVIDLKRENKILEVKLKNLKGITIVIPNKSNRKVFFESSKSKIKKEFYPVLDNFYQNVLNEINNGNYNNVEIVGYTDSVPIKNKTYRDNWDLGAARATAVVRYFIEKGMNPRLLSANTYAQYRPLSRNKQKISSQEDRRIEIVLQKVTKFR